MLASGATVRATAAGTGVSRGVVGQIRSGRRPADASRAAEARRQAAEGPARGVCPTCGHPVPLPCVACAAREQEKKRSPGRRRADALELLDQPIVVGLGLRNGHRERYEAIRAGKVAAGETPPSGQFSLRRAKHEGWTP